MFFFQRRKLVRKIKKPLPLENSRIERNEKQVFKVAYEMNLRMDGVNWRTNCYGNKEKFK